MILFCDVYYYNESKEIILKFRLVVISKGMGVGRDS